MKGMARAGKALRQVLETYDITQNRLAVAMGVGRSNIHRWVKELQDPSAESLLYIRDGLKQINTAAAETFIQIYLSSSAPDTTGAIEEP
jgi:transcriptional regulator with XRE-family HTH domain